MLKSLLIANRGEIACRIVQTCRRLGIRTVAVFSDADRGARHVAMADEAVHIGPSPAAESYLRADKILAAVRQTGAEAIHPGYGFLSESAAFARATIEAGMIFVGPTPEAMEALGAKDAAKRLAGRAGVPLVPGYHGEGQDDEMLEAEAARIGYPLLIKAVAGGGGKGMRRVEAALGFGEALAACRREAKAAFGDDRVLVERLIVRPRHIEVQVFGDSHGNVVHLFERDCTLQRRHQKIIEEAPAWGLAPELRAAIHSSAVALAQAAKYRNAGTVEFLVEAGGGFFFIEMNTRLQVEHPVTEAVTGLDLVEWQLRVASGEPLPLRQSEITCTGHAFEARLYAEDPAKGFLPSIGKIRDLRLPVADDEEEQAAGVRVDRGVRAGDEVSPFYDPMIAKLIVKGADRADALDRLVRALGRCEVQGPSTNLAFLRRVAAAEPFRAVTLDTGWLDKAGAGLAMPLAPEPDEVIAAALLVVIEDCRPRVAHSALSTEDGSPWAQRAGWRLNRAARRRVLLHHDGRGHEVIVEGTVPLFDVTGEAGRGQVRASFDAEQQRLEIERDGRSIAYAVRRQRDEIELRRDDRIVVLALDHGLDEGVAEEAGSGLLAAPMPGKVTKLLVAPGQRVEAGQTLAILEAMKMEHRFAAPAAGLVTATHVVEGEQVEEGTILIDIEPDCEG